MHCFIACFILLTEFILRCRNAVSYIHSLVQCFTPWGEQYHPTIDMSAECSNASCTEVTGLSESLVRKAAESMQVLLYPPHGGHYSCHHDTVALLQCGHFSLHVFKEEGSCNQRFEGV